MARIGLANRIRALELRNDTRRYHVLIYVPGSPIVGTPLHAHRVMLVPNFGTDAEWEAAATKHQRELVSQAQGHRR